MSELLSKAKEKIILYWMALLYALLFSGVSFAGAWMTATAGVDYSTLGSDAKARVWIGCFSVWGTTMMAFLNKAMSKIQRGELPISDGDTQLISRTTTTQAVQQTTETKV